MVTSLILLGLATEVAAPIARKEVAVLPLAGRRVETTTVEILDELLATELDHTRLYKVLGMRDIEAMLGFEKMRDALGCDEVSCFTEMGGALGVDLVLTGSVSRLGGQVIVQLSLIDVKGGTVLKRGKGTAVDRESQYLRAIQLAVADVTGKKPPAPTVVEAPPKPKKPRPTGPVSPIRYQFRTVESEYTFHLRFITPDGFNHQCDPPLKPETPCLITDMAAGEGQLTVTAEGLNPFSRSLKVDTDDELLFFEVESAKSTGSVLSFTFGGLAAGVGVALFATGLGTEIQGLWIAGIPTMVVGAGLLWLGTIFQERVHVRYPSWSLTF